VQTEGEATPQSCRDNCTEGDYAVELTLEVPDSGHEDNYRLAWPYDDAMPESCVRVPAASNQRCDDATVTHIAACAGADDEPPCLSVHARPLPLESGTYLGSNGRITLVDSDGTTWSSDDVTPTGSLSDSPVQGALMALVENDAGAQKVAWVTVRACRVEPSPCTM